MSSVRTSLPLSLRWRLDLLQTSLATSLARAQLGRLAVEDPGRVPVGDVDRQAVDDRAVAVVAREVAVAPELALGERGQRPRRVDERDVAAHDVQRLAQVELDAVHPVDVELVHPLERRVDGEHLAATTAGARARRASRRRTSRPRSRAGGRGGRARARPSIRPRRTSQRLDRLADVEAHAVLAQQRDPRVDPRLVGRRVEHAVRRAVVAAAQDVVDERLGHVADRPRAGLRSLAATRARVRPRGEDRSGTPRTCPRP